MKKIIAISGSLKRKSLNTALLKAASDLAPSNATIELIFINGIPLYNEDDEYEKGIPALVSQIKDKIAEADGIIISTPEYNNSMPGVLKNAIDWLSRPGDDIPRVFGNKPIGIIGATPGRFGTVFSQSAWLPIIRYFKMRPFFKHSLYVSSAHTLFDERSHLKDEDTRKKLQNYLKDFVDFIETA